MGIHKHALRFARYLNDVEQEKNPDTWLVRHADCAEEVIALGQISQALKSIGVEENQLKHSEMKSRQRFLEAAQRYTSQSTVTPPSSKKRARWQRMPLLQRTAMIGLVALTFLTSIGGGLVYASNSSLPGDPLYGVKLAREDTQRLFTQDTSKRILLEERLSNQRLAEVNSVLENQREVAVHFDGVLYDMQPDHWIINNLLVQIPVNTPVDGHPAPGCFVDVHAQTTSQWELIATAIKVEGTTYRGLLKTIESDILTIDGITVVVNPSMPLNPTVKAGDAVLIHTRNLPNGAQYTLSIEPDSEASESRRSELHGSLEIINATQWRIGDNTFLVTPQTHSEGNFHTGDQVKVVVVRLLDGSLFAIEIEPASDHSESPTLNLSAPEDVNKTEPEKEHEEEQKPEDIDEVAPTPQEDGEVENDDHHEASNEEDAEDTDHGDETQDNESDEHNHETHQDESEEAEETAHEQDHSSDASEVVEEREH